MAGIDIVHVPYRGGGAAALDLVGGQVQMMIDVMPNAYPLAKGGKVRGLAVTTARRFPGAPDIPTIAESGVPGFDVSAWDAIFAPAGTPPQSIQKLNAAIRQALEQPALREQLLAPARVAVAGSPDDLARFVGSEGDEVGEGRPRVRRQGRLVRYGGDCNERTDSIAGSGMDTRSRLP